MANIPLKTIKFPGLANTYTIPEVSTDLTASGKAAEAAKVGAELATLGDQLDTNTEDIDKLKADLDSLFPIDLASEVTYTGSKYVRYDTGAIPNASDMLSASDFIDVSGCTEIVYSRIYSTLTSGRFGICFYDANQDFISGSGVSGVLNHSKDCYIMSTAEVPQDAKYVRVTALADVGRVAVYDADDYNTKLVSRVERVEATAESIENRQDTLEHTNENILGRGYYTLPVDMWESGGWVSYVSQDSRAYRARVKASLIFDRDVYILADVGFKVAGTTEDGTGLGPDTCLRIPANTRFVLYSRRFTENTSSTEEVATLANAVKFSTAIAPIERYEATFTDVSMFERVGISGDSYAAGGGIISGITALTWGKNLQRQSGVQVDIYAKSGDSIVAWVQNETRGLPALLAGAECGLYWFQHGINGTSTAEVLGTPADMSANPKPQTFYGQYVYAIEAVKAAFPNAKIVMTTIVGSDWALAQSTYSATNAAIKAIAEYCEVPCIDIAEDPFFRSKFYQDGNRSSHPTAMVAAGMAQAYRRLLSKCIQSNMDYFVLYGSNS